MIQASRSSVAVNRFEDLRVWQVAKTFCDDIGAIVRRPAMDNELAICAQLNAACVSTAANIAEGFVRGGRKEFAQSVRIAAGSNAEARALLHVAHGRGRLGEDEYKRLIAETESISRRRRVLERRLRENTSTR